MSAITRGPVSNNGSFSTTVGMTAAMNVVPLNNQRELLIIQNVATSANVYYNFGPLTAPAVHTAGSFELTAGQAIILDVFVPTDQVNFIADTANTPISILTLE